MAAPYVAGIAALIRAENERADVLTVLRGTSSDRGAAGRDDRYGWGLVDADAAVDRACNCRVASGRLVVQQTIADVREVSVGKARRPPRRTEQGMKALDDSLPPVCAVERHDGRSVVTGREAGWCRLAVKARGTDEVAALSEVVTSGSTIEAERSATLLRGGGRHVVVRSGSARRDRRGPGGVEPFADAMIQPSSIDVRLDRFFRVFENHRYPHIDPAEEQPELTRLVESGSDEPFILHPGEFVLASTHEVVTLPDDVAGRLEGKSSLGRLGLLTHSTAGFIDPGFSGHVTLELSNVATLPIKLWPGMKIGQLCLFRLSSPAEHPMAPPSTALATRANAARPQPFPPELPPHRRLTPAPVLRPRGPQTSGVSAYLGRTAARTPEV